MEEEIKQEEVVTESEPIETEVTASEPVEIVETEVTASEPLPVIEY